MNTIFKYSLYTIALISLLGIGWLFGKSDFIKNRNLTTINIENNVHDFGVIKKDIEVPIYFTYRNSGDSPLVIQDIETKCGCTAAKWDREPLMPGETDSLGVYYDAKALGYFSKEVIIHFNSKKSFAKLFITGTVKEDK